MKNKNKIFWFLSQNYFFAEQSKRSILSISDYLQL